MNKHLLHAISRQLFIDPPLQLHLPPSNIAPQALAASPGSRKFVQQVNYAAKATKQGLLLTLVLVEPRNL